MMTMQEFSAEVQCKTSQVRYYCDAGLLRPQRAGEHVSNNRRYFDEHDLERMQEILIYRMIDLRISEIKEIFESPGYDQSKGIDLAIEMLRKKIKHLQNAEFLIRAAQMMGADAFNMFGVFKDEKVDHLVNAIRANPYYSKALTSIQKQTADERAEHAKAERDLIQQFSELRYTLADEDYECFASKTEGLVAKFIELNADVLPKESPESLFGIAFTYLGNGYISSKVDEIGGEGTAAVMGFCFLLSWGTKAVRILSPIISTLHNQIESNQETRATINDLKDAIHEHLISDYTASASIDGVVPGDYIETVANLFAGMKSFLDDEEMMQIADLADVEAPKEEAYETALAALRNEEDRKAERSPE